MLEDNEITHCIVDMDRMSPGEWAAIWQAKLREMLMSPNDDSADEISELEFAIDKIRNAARAAYDTLEAAL